MDARGSSTFGLLVLAVAGCGAGSAKPDAAPQDGRFAVCAGYDAGPYMAGYTTPSVGGGYSVTLESVEAATKPPVATPAVAANTFVVSVRDAGGNAPVGLTMTAEKPVMPRHMHSAPNFPVVADKGGGSFEVSMIAFFMPGYWELTLNLLPADDGGTTPDKVVLSICVPS